MHVKEKAAAANLLVKNISAKKKSIEKTEMETLQNLVLVVSKPIRKRIKNFRSKIRAETFGVGISIIEPKSHNDDLIFLLALTNETFDSSKDSTKLNMKLVKVKSLLLHEQVMHI